MKATLKNKAPIPYIHVLDMEDGQVAEIVEWKQVNVDDPYEGRIVQRVGSDLITIGSGRGNTWIELFKCNLKDLPKCIVRLLQNGEEIVINNFK